MKVPVDNIFWNRLKNPAKKDFSWRVFLRETILFLISIYLFTITNKLLNQDKLVKIMFMNYSHTNQFAKDKR